jgi:very-short-patch-repair endonuclease
MTVGGAGTYGQQEGTFQVFGSPLPSAGEGFGGEGERAIVRQQASDQGMANILSCSRAPSFGQAVREARLEASLDRQLLRYKFCRQVPLGNAIVDFCCRSLKLVVQLDGAGHAHEARVTRDQQRDRIREKRVPRAWSPESYCAEGGLQSS